MRNLSSSTTKVVETAANAEVVLAVPVVVDDKDVLSLSSGGAVREYQLKRVAFRLHGKDGLDWIPAAIVVRRYGTRRRCSRATCRSSASSARCRRTPSGGS